MKEFLKYIFMLPYAVLVIIVSLFLATALYFKGRLLLFVLFRKEETLECSFPKLWPFLLKAKQYKNEISAFIWFLIITFLII